MSWRAACLEMNGVDNWYVLDDSDNAQPVAICPRGRDVAVEIARSKTENERLRAALNEIASWGEGEVVSSKFDCPWASGTARDALARKPDQY